MEENCGELIFPTKSHRLYDPVKQIAFINLNRYYWRKYNDFFFLTYQLAERARGVVHVMLNGTRQHFLDKQIFPTFMDDRFELLFAFID